MKILFLTNLLPYPLDNGGKIKTYTTLQALHNAGHEIDLVCFKETNKDMSETESCLLNKCKSIKQIYLKLTTAEYKVYMFKKALQSLFSKYSFGTFKFQCKEMETLLNSYSSNNYDCIYYDHLQMFVYANLIKRLWPCAKTILDEHNCEVKIMYRNAINSRNPLKKVFMLLEAKKLSVFEAYAITHVNKTIVLSEEDKNEISHNGKIEFNYTIIPIGINEPKSIKSISKRNDNVQKILFLGTMTWAPNNDGIVWFIENVYTQIYKGNNHVELYIVGKNPSEKVKELSRRLKGIILTGYVENVDPYYEMCDFMIVPLFVGSGQRVKIIEAFSKGMPVIATTVGAEGLKYTDGKDILIADSAEQFVQKINCMNDIELRRSLRNNARLLFEDNYSVNAVEAAINQAVI